MIPTPGLICFTGKQIALLIKLKVSPPSGFHTSLFDAFSHLRNLRKRVQRRVTTPHGTCFVCSTKLSPARWVSAWMGDQIRIPRVVIICFFSPFFPLPFSKAILKTAELAFLRNIVSSLNQLFVPRFAMAVFMCIHLHYRIHKH